jgi:nucleoid DNA-binding protein
MELNELIKLITQKTGISEEQAKQAIEQVVEFLKQRLPAPIASQIDGLLGGGMPDLSQGLGGLFGRK